MNTRRITWLALGALAVGLLAGAAIAESQLTGGERLIRVLEPIGTLWISAVQMTIIPLVISMLIAALASSDSLSTMGRLGGAALGFFVAMVGITAVLAVVLGPVMFAGLQIDPASATALRETATSSSARVQSTVQGMGGIADRIVALIPPNAFRAAADGSMLPLIVFATIFGAALSRIPPNLRRTPVEFFRGVSEAMLVIIRWVFAAAPLGVFALAIVVGARLGYAAAAAVAWYLGVFATVMLLVMAIVYVVAVTLGRTPLRRFATAVAPAQVIALGSRSSSAALPSMIDSARDMLRLPAPVVSFVLPAAVAVFRISVPVSFIIGALFLGKLYGVTLDVGAMTLLAVLSILLSFSVPPVPSGSLFMMAPVFADIGIPVEGVAILIALDVIPDLLKTTTIVTAHMASAVVVARLGREQSIAPEREIAAA